MIGLIPAPYRILAIALLAAALVAGGYWRGAANVQKQWDKAIADQALQVAQVQTKQAEVTTKVVTEYVDRVQVVRERGKTIIKEVPVYVTKVDDAACVINTGFVRLHDSSASGSIAAAPGASDAAPSGVALSAVAATVADNYGRCHENAEQLMALQTWVRKQSQIQ